MLPEVFQFIQRVRFERLLRRIFQFLKAVLKFRVRVPKRRLCIQAELAHEIHGGEEQVARFFVNVGW